MQGRANVVRLLFTGLGALSLAPAIPSWAAPEDDIQAAAAKYEQCIETAKEGFDKPFPVDGGLGKRVEDAIVGRCREAMDDFVALLPERYKTSVPAEVEALARPHLRD